MSLSQDQVENHNLSRDFKTKLRTLAAENGTRIAQPCKEARKQETR